MMNAPIPRMLLQVSVLLLVSLVSFPLLAREVTVSGGRVSGITTDGVTVYKGIPYAGATGGDNRWRPPQRPMPWDGVLEADAFGPPCVQALSNPADPTTPPVIIGSEDCLTLNVYVPDRRGAARGRLPVMVWIHGGSFRVGSAADYDASKLARMGVVVVTINYRLDFLGRFAHPALSAAQSGEFLGHYALMDQIAARQWVQENIAQFKGNPRRVTIFGQSAGGVSVNYLMASPHARGLFRSAVSHSGGIRIDNARYLDRTDPLNPVSLEDQGAQLGAFFGIPDDAMAPDSLRALTAEQLLLEFPEFENSLNPVVDGDLIPAPVSKIFEEGRQNRAHYIGGGTSHEMSFFASIPDSVLPLFVLLQGFDEADVRWLYRDYEGLPLDADGNPTDGYVKSLWVSDLSFVAPHKYLARQMFQIGRRGYFYYFDYVPSWLQGSPITELGLFHGGDVPFIFGNLPPFATPEDHDVSQRLMLALTRFARTGNPNPRRRFRTSQPWWWSPLEWRPLVPWQDATSVHRVDGIRSIQDFEDIAERMDFLMDAWDQSVPALP